LYTKRLTESFQLEQLSSTIDWQVMELQTGAKIWDLEANPPGNAGVKMKFKNHLSAQKALHGWLQAV